MQDANRWRLLNHGGGSAALNMAVDEALLECARLAGDQWWSHTLRLYWFVPPALSIGAFQPIEEIDLPASTRARVAVVRRPTGGRAVLHDGCITYSLCGHSDGPLFEGGVRPSYRRIAAALVAAVESLGAPGVTAAPAELQPPAGPSCFDSAAPFELLAGGRKIAGNAQVRRGAAALQHGSIRLNHGPISIAGLFRHRAGRPQSRTSEEPPVLADLVGAPISREQAALAVQRAFATTFGVQLDPSHLTRQEEELATRLELERYSQPAWTERR